jgi:U32 family peptidase
MTKIEMLAPAGDLYRLKIALRFGADAVYIGGKQYSLRSRASNFSIDEIAQAVEITHAFHKKLFVTANMIFHNEDLPGFIEYVVTLDKLGVDAVIIASVAMARQAKAVVTTMEVHLSTQMSAMNHLDLAFYQSLGIDRVVLAREVDLDNLGLMMQHTDMPIEVFIHGAMCTNYSGRCTLSNEMTNRDANRGGCAQSCRWRYRLFSQSSLIDEQQMFSMSAKDLSAIRFVPQLISLGINSLKIEGRMKSAYYLACVIRAYRTMIDQYYSPQTDQDLLLKELTAELLKAENRLSSEGFYDHLPDESDHLYGINGAGVTHEFVGIIKSYDHDNHMALVEVRNYFMVGDKLELLCPVYSHQRFIVEEMFDGLMEPMMIANQPMSEVYVRVPFKVETDDMLRIIK